MYVNFLPRHIQFGFHHSVPFSEEPKWLYNQVSHLAAFSQDLGCAREVR